MSQLTQQTYEMIVDVLTIYHAGNAGYPDYATEQVQNEAWGIHMRMDKLKKQGVPVGRRLPQVAETNTPQLMDVTGECLL